MLQGGLVVEQGTHGELLAQEDSLYRRYHALQFRWDRESTVATAEALARVTPEALEWADPAGPIPPDMPLLTPDLEHELGE